MDAPREAPLVVRGCLVMAGAGEEPRAADIVADGGAVRELAAPGTPVPGARELDARGTVAIPGLVNAHTHSPENCLRGLAEGLPLEPWLAEMFAAAGRFDADAHYACAAAGALEMLRGGVTGVIDHLWMTPPSPEAVDAACRAYADAGMRAVVAPLSSDTDVTGALGDRMGVDLSGALLTDVLPLLPAAEHLALLDDAMRRWNAPGGNVRVFAGPGGVQWASDELLAGAAELARRHGAGVHIHLLETVVQRDACRERFGASAVEGLDRLGVLGPWCSLPHSVWLGPADIARIAERGAVPVHNPAANLRLGSGTAPVRDLLDAGVTVALGTDGAASSDTQSMWEAIRLAALVHNRDGRWVGGREALAMATSGGAAAMLAPAGAGRIDAGSPADITLVDLAGEGLAGAGDLHGALALSETGRGVRHVVVAGRPVLVDGRCPGLDEEGIRDALREQARRRASERRPSAAARTVRTAFTALRGVLAPADSRQHTEEVCR